MTDLNTDGLMGTINNTFEVTEGATDEISNESSTIGQLFVAALVLVLAAFALSLLLGIPQKVVKGIANILKGMK